MKFEVPKTLSNLRVVLQPLDYSLEYMNKWAKCPERLNVGDVLGDGEFGKAVVRPSFTYLLLPAYSDEVSCSLYHSLLDLIHNFL